MQEKIKQAIKDHINKKQESTYLDFKVQWPNDNVELIHDILCLCNCQHNDDRCLIIDVADNFFITLRSEFPLLLVQEIQIECGAKFPFFRRGGFFHKR